MDMNDTVNKLSSFAERGARWFVRRRVGGEEKIKELIESAGAEAPDAIIDEVAAKTARKAAIRAFLTGTVGSPYMALPLALVDLQGATAAEAKIAATAALVRDPAFFRRQTWDKEILFAMLDLDPESARGVVLTKSLAKRIAIGRAKKYAMRVATNTIPMVGGIVGATIEYTLLKRRAEAFKSRFSAPARPQPVTSRELRSMETPAPPPTATRPPAPVPMANEPAIS